MGHTFTEIQQKAQFGTLKQLFRLVSLVTGACLQVFLPSASHPRGGTPLPLWTFARNAWV